MYDREFQQKCISWYDSAYKEITLAKGVPSGVLDLMPEQLKEILIRNDLQLIYVGKQK